MATLTSGVGGIRSMHSDIKGVYKCFRNALILVGLSDSGLMCLCFFVFLFLFFRWEQVPSLRTPTRTTTTPPTVSSCIWTPEMRSSSNWTEAKPTVATTTNTALSPVSSYMPTEPQSSRRREEEEDDGTGRSRLYHPSALFSLHRIIRRFNHLFIYLFF